MVVGVYAHTVAYAERSVLSVNGRAGVAFFFGVVPVGFISKELKVQLPRLHLGFLQAEEVGVQFRKYVGKTFARHGPEAVYVP